MKRFLIGMLGSTVTLALLCACVSSTPFITDYDDPLPGPGACLNVDPSQRLVSQEGDGANDARIPRRSSRRYAAQPSDALWHTGDRVTIVPVEASSRTGSLRLALEDDLPRQEGLPNADLALRRRSLNNVCKNIRKMDHVLMANWLTRDLSRMIPPEARAPRRRPQLSQAGRRSGRRILV